MVEKKNKQAKRKHERLFFQLVTERIENFEKKGQNKSAANTKSALKHFTIFREGADLDVRDLSVNLIKDFQDYLVRVKNLKMNTVSLYMRMLRAAYNYAVEEEIIEEDKRPFRKAFTGQEKTRKRAIGKPMVKRLIELKTNNQALAFARDIFLFSIFMQGMPFVDIAHLKKAQLRNGYILYQRRKTNRTLKVRIPREAQEIIDKYRIKDPGCPFLFPILITGKGNSPGRYDSALRLYNKRLARLSALLGIDEPFTSYVSRHTWASLAHACGISDSIICEAMGHNNIETTTIYLAALDMDVIASANRKLIASLMRWRI